MIQHFTILPTSLTVKNVVSIVKCSFPVTLIKDINWKFPTQANVDKTLLGIGLKNARTVVTDVCYCFGNII